MKKTLFALAFVILLAGPASAQTYLSSTTLSAAVSSTTQDSIVVASATNVEAGGALYIDHELFDVVSVSGTRVQVSRRQRPATHLSGATVIVATRAQKASVFVAHESALSLSGSCDPANYQYLPIVDVVYGDVYLCWSKTAAQGRIWSRTNMYPQNGLGSLLLNLQ